MSDGGEGLLEALGGQRRTTVVRARWARRSRPSGACWPSADGDGPDRRASRCPRPRAAPPAPPRGRRPGARRHGRRGPTDPGRRRRRGAAVVVAAGARPPPTAGWGAVEAIGSPAGSAGVELVVACDVTTPFRDAAAVFGPQKGATPGAGRGARRRARRAGRALPARVRRRRRPPCPAPARPAGWPAGWPRSGRASCPASSSWPSLVGLAGRAGSGRPRGHRRGPPRSPVVRRQGARRRADSPRPGGRGPCRSCAWSAAPTPSVPARPPPGVEVVSLTARFGRPGPGARRPALVGQVIAERARPGFAPERARSATLLAPAPRRPCGRAAGPSPPGPAGSGTSTDREASPWDCSTARSPSSPAPAGASAAKRRSCSPARAPRSSSTTSAPDCTARAQRRAPRPGGRRTHQERGGTAAVNGDDISTWAGGKNVVDQADRHLRLPRHPGEQRRDPPGQDVLQHGGVGLGRRHPGPPEGPLRRRRTSPRSTGATRPRRARTSLGPHHQHLVGGRPLRQRRPGQLLGGQGRHRLDDLGAGPRARSLRRHRPTPSPPRPHPHDRDHLRRRGMAAEDGGFDAWDPKNMAQLVGVPGRAGGGRRERADLRGLRRRHLGHERLPGRWARSTATTPGRPTELVAAKGELFKGISSGVPEFSFF